MPIFDDEHRRAPPSPLRRRKHHRGADLRIVTGSFELELTINAARWRKRHEARSVYGNRADME